MSMQVEINAGSRGGRRARKALPQVPRAPSRGIQMARMKALPAVPRRRGNKPLPPRPGFSAGRRYNPQRRNPGGSGPRNPMGRGFPSGNRSRGTRTCRVEEDEYIADIAGSTGFATTAFPVNPGQVTTFPWLSKQAAQWEKYRWEYLEFYYKPEVSAFATQGQAGKVILSMDYYASDAAPSSKQMAEDTDPHADAMPYEDLILILDPRQMFELADSKYVRPGGLPGSTDIKTYDSGNLSVSTIANTNTSLLGELHVRYAVVFEVPVLETAPGGSVAANNQVAFLQSASAGEALTAGTPLQMLLAAPNPPNGIGLVNTAGSMVPPAGNYLVDFQVTADSASNVDTGLKADFQKNGTSVFVSTKSIPLQSNTVGDVAYSCACGVFVTANGTDAFTFVVTETAGAGATAGGTCRWTAI